MQSLIPMLSYMPGNEAKLPAAINTAQGNSLKIVKPPTGIRIHEYHISLSRGIVLRLHTETLLVSLPTPDFSMPYNVICFVCTIIAIGFGSVFNLTTRTLQPATAKNQGLLSRLLGRLRLKRRKPEPNTDSPPEDTS